MAGELRVLMLEDSPLDAELCESQLRASGLQFEALRVDTAAAFEDALESFAPDLIISDFSLPGNFDGLAALDVTRSRGRETPFVFVSGTIGEERAVDAMKRGATDYVLKDKLERLVPVIDRALKERAERAALEEARVRLARLSRVRTVLGSINGAIIRIREAQPLYDEVCRIAIEDGGFSHAWVGELESRSLEVTPRAWSPGCNPHMLERGSISASERGPHGGGLIGVALRTGRPVHTADAALDYPLFEFAGGRDQKQSVAVLPLTIDDEPCAVMCLYTPEPGFFDAEEMKLLRELAANISFALSSIDKASRLDYLAYYDALTGLANRKLFDDRLEQLLARAGAEDALVMVMTIDLERFRSINETYGAAGGDRVLKTTAERLTRLCEPLGTAARFSSDLFAVALPIAARHGETLPQMVEEARAALQSPVALGEETLSVQAKIGIAVFPGDGSSAQTLVANAEAALKKAKRSGERFLFYAREMNARAAALLKLENRLRHALEDEQFVLHYEPRMSLATRKLVGLEALLRWQDPDGGLIAPAEFMPLLEETGLILEVGAWVLERVLADVATWRARGYAPPRIGVNVSALQLRQKDFVERITAAFRRPEGIDDGFEVELTESMIMSDVEDAVAKLREIRAAGVRIAIDDFGTGYSSLSYLVKLPIDTLKIDRAFVTSMSTSPEHMAIVRTVMSLAEALRLHIIAEGVETAEQANILRLIRCDEAQGFLFGGPLAPEALERMLPAAPALSRPERTRNGI